MIQLQILSGKAAGTSVVARRFPFRIGRGPGDDLRIEAPGVWEGHAELLWDPDRSIVLRPRADAPTWVNEEPATGTSLRSGDVVTVGGVRIQVGLSPVRQLNLVPREVMTWVAFALLALGQAASVYWLSR